jgi:hypothetical protein
LFLTSLFSLLTSSSFFRLFLTFLWLFFYPMVFLWPFWPCFVFKSGSSQFFLL